MRLIPDWARAALLGLAFLAPPALAQDAAGGDALIERAITDHILPRFAGFTAAADALSRAATTCSDDEASLRAAYHDAFDAWLGVSHIRMGPSEEGDAAFAIAFWPDPKGFTAKTLRRLIAARDPAIADPQGFAEVSIAARGFFALERFLFDPAFAAPEDGYRCRFVAAIALDIAHMAHTIEAGWRDGFADELRRADGSNSGVQALYGALKTGAEFTLTARVERPLGDGDRARPNRAEAWRSARAARNIRLSVAALDAMFEDVFAPALPAAEADLIRGSLAHARAQAKSLNRPLREMLAEPLGRGQAITLRFAMIDVLEHLEGRLRPALGLSLSFNALDGD